MFRLQARQRRNHGRIGAASGAASELILANHYRASTELKTVIDGTATC
jgi:hypothetical protein